MTTQTINGYTVTTEVNAINGDTRCVAFKNGEPVFGTFSSSGSLISALDKMKLKIYDAKNYENNICKLLKSL